MIGEPNSERNPKRRAGTGPNARSRRGRPPRVRRADVIAAGVELVAVDGLERLTMRAVAARIGLSEMGVYRHVSSHDELHAGVVDAVLGLVAVPDAIGSAGEWLPRLAGGLIDVMAGHPGVAEHLAVHGPSGPCGIEIMAAIMRTLVRHGIPAALVPSAHGLYTSTACGVAMLRSRIERGVARPWAEGAGDRLAALRDDPLLGPVLPEFSGDIGRYERYAMDRVIGVVLADAVGP